MPLKGSRARRGDGARGRRGRSSAARPSDVGEDSQSSALPQATDVNMESVEAQEATEQITSAEAMEVTMQEAEASAVDTGDLAGEPSLGSIWRGARRGLPRSQALQGSSRLKHQPKSNVRRSQLERDAQEQAELDRMQQRAAEAARGSHSGFRGRSRRGRGTFRGGLSGWRNESGGSTSATGFFGAPAHENGSAVTRVKSRGGGGGGGRGSRIRASARSSPSKGKSIASGAASGDVPIKKEETDVIGFGNGDLDDDVIDLELLNFSELLRDSDSGGEERAEGSSKHAKNKSSAGSSDWYMGPVRLPTRERTERDAGLGSVIHTGKSTQRRDKAKEDNSFIVIADEPNDNAPSTSTKTTKTTKKKERQFKGVFPIEELYIPELKRKAPTIAPPTPVQPLEPDLEPDLDKHLPDISRRQSVGPSTPVPKPTTAKPKKEKEREEAELMGLNLNMLEDVIEYDRYKADLKAIREELGPSIPEDTHDENGDINMETEVKDRRKDLVYYFQLPPVLPNMVSPEDATRMRREKAAADEAALKEANAPPIKKEYKPHKKTASKAPESTKDDDEQEIKVEDEPEVERNGPRFEMTATTEDEFEGPVGEMVVYENGETVLTWGDIEFSVSKGVGEMLKEVAIRDDEVETAISMGQVAGTFIVAPDFEKLLAETKE